MQYNNMNVPGQSGGSVPPMQNNTPPSMPGGDGNSNRKLLFIGGGVIVVLIVVIAILLVVVLGDKDDDLGKTGENVVKEEVRAVLEEIVNDESTKSNQQADSFRKITEIGVVAKAIEIYHVSAGEYPTSGISAVAYRCEAGEVSGGLKDVVSQWIDERNEVPWEDIIYGVDDLNNPQTYVLGVRGMLEGYGSLYRSLEDDLDLGSRINDEYAIAFSSGGAPSAGAWDCDCGSADESDSVYCETNRRM